MDRTTDREPVPSQCQWECILRKDKGLVFYLLENNVLVNVLVVDKNTVWHLKP